ncbi:hypothetical protein HDV05_002328, partial [Chytridiales sp. JEL 0842]
VIKAELEEESLGHLWTLDDPLTPLVYPEGTTFTEPVPTIGVAALLLIPANPATPFQPDPADEEQATLRQRAEMYEKALARVHRSINIQAANLRTRRKEATEFCKARKLILNHFPPSMHIGTSTIPSVPALRALLLGKVKQVNPRSYLHQWEHFFGQLKLDKEKRESFDEVSVFLKAAAAHIELVIEQYISTLPADQQVTETETIFDRYKSKILSAGIKVPSLSWILSKLDNDEDPPAYDSIASLSKAIQTVLTKETTLKVQDQDLATTNKKNPVANTAKTNDTNKQTSTNPQDRCRIHKQSNHTNENCFQQRCKIHPESQHLNEECRQQQKQPRSTLNTTKSTNSKVKKPNKTNKKDKRPSKNKTSNTVCGICEGTHQANECKALS